MDDEAQTKVIDLPLYLDSFDPDQDGCDLNAAFCCWVQDRQANDNNGNCNTPYESQCIDRDPGDNTNFCYTDHSRSSTAHNVDGGFSVFGNVLNGAENIEGSVHCHGFAWAQDDTDISSVYKGNNLFFVSLYDHMYQRGYVRNAPGSAMCGCAENMAVVTRADCTEIAAAETFTFTYTAATAEFSGLLSKVRDLNFNACQGANGRNNDLEAYYRRLVNEGKQTQENLDALHEILVGTARGQCNQAITNFMSTKGIIRSNADEIGADKPEGYVEVIDPDLQYASGGGDNMMMPDVPYDPALAAEDTPNLDNQEPVYTDESEEESPISDVTFDDPDNVEEIIGADSTFEDTF